MVPGANQNCRTLEHSYIGNLGVQTLACVIKGVWEFVPKKNHN